jgi:LacI family transcriptional regulator
MGIPRVALLIESSNAYGRGILAGIARFLQEQKPWSVFLPETGRSDTAGDCLRGWKGDGLIVRAESKRVARATSACACPVVDLCVDRNLPSAPAVHSNVELEAKLGFGHLWERGFRNVGFCGVSDYSWVKLQYKGFLAAAAASGAVVSTHIQPLGLREPKGWVADRAALVKWLRGLPKPVGIFSCYDLRGQQLLDACRHVGLRVPEDVAVVGVDNDPVRCSLSDPPLSSVAPDTNRIGYLAAELLAALMEGKRVRAEVQFVDPIGVIARRSTEALTVEDPDVAAAVKFIRDHCCEGIDVEQVLEHVPLSRRALEARFVRHVGRTPHAEILRCRVERAKQLLSDSDMPVKAVAHRVGVGAPEYLSVLFRRTVGMTPSAYRTKHRRPRAPVI